MYRVMLTTIVGLLLSACASGVSYQNVKVGMSEKPTERVSGLFAKPSGKGPFPAVVLLHSCGGVQSNVSEDWPNFLTANGYAALTVDTFGSRNAGRCPKARSLGGVEMVRDAYGALEYLASRPDIDGDRIGVMGFSLGGIVIENIATSRLKSPSGRNFKAGITFYGFCFISEKPSFTLLAIIGDQDSNSENCSDGAAKGMLVDIIPGATHAFDNRRLSYMQVVSGGHSSIYSGSATNKAQDSTRKFLEKYLAK